MKELTYTVSSAEEAQAYIDRCEENFQREITGALENLFREDVPKVIALSGPTCSGKTTTASFLTERIRKAGDHAVVMSIDDFFFDQNSINVVGGESPDYDSVRAIDLAYLGKVTERLLNGKEALIPHYSFTEASRVGYREYYPGEHDIYVYEGIQAVYPEVTALFGRAYKSIFICVTDDISYRGVDLSKHELRLLRRLVRDYRFRGATAEFTLHLWEGVRDNEEKHIFPNAQNCDIYINSFLPYEPFIIADDAAELLETVPQNSRYRKEADALLEKIAVFEHSCFEDRMVPAHSVFREFIG
ncbi:MAG: hypothetical protein IJC71_08685 [Clostridia bacterium]|nr:hypothetical protein [Clostridia bacterium]